MKKIVFCVFASILLLGCDSFVHEVNYKGKNYTIADSEFGVAFINQYDGVEYYMDDTIYKCDDNYYCLISGSQDKGDRWVFIQGNKAVNIDSTKANFTSLCKKTLKGDLLD